MSFQSWDSFPSLIVCADHADEAQKQFEAWLRTTPEGENPVQTEIKKLVAVQFMEQLFTESGYEPIDWALISQRIETTPQSDDGDNLEQGYWADVNQLVRPEKLSADIESLRHDLPEDIRSGLNWSADKQFFFVVSVLSPPMPPAVAEVEPESETTNPDDSSVAELDSWEAALPEMADKEVAALVQARNSAVAAWLWRKFAVGTQFVANDIDIDPWCGVVVLKEEQDQPREEC